MAYRWVGEGVRIGLGVGVRNRVSAENLVGRREFSEKPGFLD